MLVVALVVTPAAIYTGLQGGHLSFHFSLEPPFHSSSLVAQMVKHLPIVWETWVQSLGREDLLEKEMALHSSTLAWKTPWMEEPGRLQSIESRRVGHD